METFPPHQSLANGGAERVTVELANYWASQGWRVSIATLSSEQKDFYKVNSSIERITLGLDQVGGGMFSFLFKNIRRVLALRRVLQERQPDIAIAMMTEANVLLALAAQGINVKSVGSERIYPPSNPIGRIREWSRLKTYGLLDALVMQTETGKRWASGALQLENVPVIPNAVTWPMSRHEPIVTPETLIASNRKFLLAVGRLTHQKGFDILIRVFESLAHKHSDWDLVIVGDGDERTVLKDMIQKKGLADQILMPGRIGNLGDWYDSADLFVLSSRYEGFPNALLEAMSYGLPVVSFDCPAGPRDIIRNEIDGILVEAENTGAMRDALDALMANERYRVQLSSHSSEVCDQFSMHSITRQWEELFKSIL